MNELMINKVKETINNKALIKELNGIGQALKSANKSAWKIAKHMHNIVNGELFVDDFGNLDKLSERIGYSKSTISAYSRAYEYYEAISEEEELKAVTVGQVIECIPYLKGIDKDEEWAQRVKGVLIGVKGLSTKDIRATIKTLLNPPAEEEVETEVEEETETETETEGTAQIGDSRKNKEEKLKKDVELPITVTFRKGTKASELNAFKQVLTQYAHNTGAKIEFF